MSDGVNTKRGIGFTDLEKIEIFFKKITAEFSYLEDFHILAESAWVSHHKNAVDNLSEWLKKLRENSSKNSPQIKEHLMSELNRIEFTFPQIQRGNIVITALSYFEVSIVELCYLLGEITNASNSYERPNSKVVKHAVKYMQKDCCLNMSSVISSDEWQFLFRAIYLRNRIVHNGGYLKCDDEGGLDMGEDLVVFIKNQQNLGILSISDEMLQKLPRIEIYPDFVNDLCGKLCVLCKYLYDEINLTLVAQKISSPLD